jgi:hypothetical protein
MIDLIYKYSSCLLSIEDIALLIDVDESELREKIISDKQLPESRAYRLGIAETRYAIRKHEVNLAKEGSPVALSNIKDYLLEQFQSEF